MKQEQLTLEHCLVWLKNKNKTNKNRLIHQQEARSIQSAYQRPWHRDAGFFSRWYLRWIQRRGPFLHFMVFCFHFAQASQCSGALRPHQVMLECGCHMMLGTKFSTRHTVHLFYHLSHTLRAKHFYFILSFCF